MDYLKTMSYKGVRIEPVYLVQAKLNAKELIEFHKNEMEFLDKLSKEGFTLNGYHKDNIKNQSR